MRDVLIVGAARTAIGKSPRGTLRYTRPDDMAAVALQAAIERAGVDAAEVEDVILGCAQPELEQGLNIGRLAALRAGLPMSVPGLTVNRFCASGLEAIAIGAQRIACGSAETIIAGGAESMSMVNFMGSTTRPNPRLMESHPDTYLSMGLCVEQLSRRYRVGREESDAFSVQSHCKALAARDSGRFAEEIVPVPVTLQEMNGDGKPEVKEIRFDSDEGPRPDTSEEGLAKLKPA